jgi:DNA-binding IscR family transcriptional regulator
VTKKKTTKRKSIGALILAALARKPEGLTSDKLAVRAGARGDSVSSICSRLRAKGLVKRLDGGAGRGTEAVWGLTPAGRKLVG